MNEVRHYELRFAVKPKVESVVTSLREAYLEHMLTQSDVSNQDLAIHFAGIRTTPAREPFLFSPNDYLLHLGVESENFNPINAYFKERTAGISRMKTLGETSVPVYDGVFSGTYSFFATSKELKGAFEMGKNVAVENYPNVTFEENFFSGFFNPAINFSVSGNVGDVSAVRTIMTNSLPHWNSKRHKEKFEKIPVPGKTQVVPELDLLVEKYGKYEA